MKTVPVFCAVIMILTGACDGRNSVPAPQGGQISNGGFEDKFDGWMFSTSPDSEIFRIAKSKEAYQGKRAAVMNLDADEDATPPDYAYLGRRDLPVDPGFYRLRFAMRSELETGSGGAHIMAQDAAGQNLMTVVPGVENAPIITGTSEWNQYSLVYRVPEDTEAVALQMQMSDASGKVWIDAVEVEPVSAPSSTNSQIMNTQTVPSAIEFGAVLLGKPCQNVSIFRSLLATDPTTKSHLLVANSCTSEHHGCALFVDYDTETTAVVPFPVGSGGWDIIETKPGEFLFESLDPLFLVPIDLTSRKIIEERIIAIQENQYGWRFTKGTDGSIYFGSYPTCHAYRFDPEQGTVEDLGLIGPEGNAYVRFVALAEDRFLICSVMSEKSGVVAFDTETKTQTWIEVSSESPRLKDVGGIVYATIGGRLQQFDSQSMQFRNPDLTAPKDVFWTAISDESNPARIILTGSDGAIYALDSGALPRMIWNLPLRGGSVVGLDDQNRVVGIRGQDYFVAEPLSDEVQLRPIADNPPPVAIHFIKSDPNGGIIGGPSLGQTLFRFDLLRGLQQNTSQVVDRNGEVYDGLWINNKFYFVSYSGGDLGVWDPAQPWDQWNGNNPKVLAKYDAESTLSLIRPQGGVKIGPQGRLYAGWSATYGLAWGGLTEYDLNAQSSRVWSSDLLDEGVSIGSIEADEKYVYGVTSNQLNGLVQPPKTLQFFVFDPSSEKVVLQIPLALDARNPRIVRVPDSGNIWIATEHGVQKFNSKTLKFSELLPWPAGTPQPAPADSADTNDNRAWFGVGTVVVQLTDSTPPTIETLFSTERGLQSLAADGKQLYFTQREEVWSAPLQ